MWPLKSLFTSTAVAKHNQNLLPSEDAYKYHMQLEEYRTAFKLLYK